MFPCCELQCLSSRIPRRDLVAIEFEDRGSGSAHDRPETRAHQISKIHVRYLLSKYTPDECHIEHPGRISRGVFLAGCEIVEPDKRWCGAQFNAF